MLGKVCRINIAKPKSISARIEFPLYSVIAEISTTFAFNVFYYAVYVFEIMSTRFMKLHNYMKS